MGPLMNARLATSLVDEVADDELHAAGGVGHHGVGARGVRHAAEDDDRHRRRRDRGFELVRHAQRREDHPVNEAAAEAADEVERRLGVPGAGDDQSIVGCRDHAFDRAHHLDVDRVADVGHRVCELLGSAELERSRRGVGRVAEFRGSGVNFPDRLGTRHESVESSRGRCDGHSGTSGDIVDGDTRHIRSLDPQPHCFGWKRFHSLGTMSSPVPFFVSARGGCAYRGSHRHPEREGDTHARSEGAQEPAWSRRRRRSRRQPDPVRPRGGGGLRDGSRPASGSERARQRRLPRTTPTESASPTPTPTQTAERHTDSDEFSDSRPHAHRVGEPDPFARHRHPHPRPRHHPRRPPP